VSGGGGNPHVEWLRGGDAFGPPGALERLSEDPRRLAGIAQFIVSARARLRELRPDTIVAQWLVPSAFPIALGVACALEIVVHGSDVRVLERLPRAVRLALVKTLVNQGATFRFVSHDLRDQLGQSTRVQWFRDARVKPSPIDVRSAPSRADARRALSIPEDVRLAVIVARLVPGKRVDVAIDLARNDGATRIVVVGDGPERARLRALATDAEFTGSLPRHEALTWIAAADVLTSASRDEGAPTVIREARALGVPVVAVPCGDLATWAADDPGVSLREGGA